MSPVPDLTTCAFPGLPPPVSLQLPVMPEHPCPYFADRLAAYRACRAERIPGSLYHRFMDANFRRSGDVLYQPVCRGCRLCVQIRVPVDRFAPGRSQRRCWRRNADVRVTVAPPAMTDEKVDLYRRYVREWHGRREHATVDDDPTPDDVRRFLYTSPVDTIEFTHRAADGKLLAVGICDACEHSLSSVYFFFDPTESRRGLGTFGAIAEIEWAKARTIPWYYLGYWVSGCPQMDYKTSYRPFELLGPDGIWREGKGAGGWLNVRRLAGKP